VPGLAGKKKGKGAQPFSFNFAKHLSGDRYHDPPVQLLSAI
jgi:hypothetical protein